MATNATCSSEQRLQAIEEYSAGLHPAYLDLLTNAVFAALMVPFLLSLFFFSNAHRRRSLMFVLVVLSVVLALVQYAYEMSLRMDGLNHPQEASTALTPTILTSILILRDLPNVVVDLALFARLFVVYPPSTTSRHTLAVVLAPAVLIKIARVASMAVIYVYDDQNKQGAGLYIYWSPWEHAWLIANRVLAVLDNTYPTAFFLWKLKTAFISDSELGRATDTISGRIRTLFWIALTNFLIPVPLYLAQLAQTIVDSNSTTFAYFQLYIVFSSVLCVAFATVWASSLPMRAALQHEHESERTRTTALRFAPVTTDRTSADQSIAEGRVPPPTKPQQYPLQVRLDLLEETV